MAAAARRSPSHNEMPPAPDLGGIDWRQVAESLGEVAPGPRSAPEPRQTLAARVAGVRGPCFWPALPGKPALAALERASLVRLAEASVGDWDAETMVAAMEAMRHAPAGDVVEVGVAGARSAALLVRLARRYEVGKTLCVGDWSEAALAAFQVDLLALAEGDLNHLPNSADDAAALYRPGLRVSTDAFGEVAYEGRIALLHVGDGVDARNWTRRVTTGGWIVFDEDAAEAGQAFAAARADAVQARFHGGGALFMQLKR